MKILLFHPALLPPKNYGGVERVVLWLARGLIEAGHEVWVGAYPGSRLPAGAKLIEFPEGDASAHSLIKKLPPGLDVVHFQAPPEAGVIESLPCASVLTVHGNGKPGEEFPRNTVFLSADHARRHGRETHVFNGIDPAEYRFDPTSKKGEFLFLSKTSWKVKNVRGAIRLCGKAGAKLGVAGGSRPWGARLRVAMMPGSRWIGAVSGEEKAKELARARALLFPVLWSEPFGLVIAEALMSGTPVLASRIGSVPELLGDEVGLTLPPPVGSMDPMAEVKWVEAIRELATNGSRFEPEACRAWAMRFFHYQGMTEAYVRVYKRVTSGDSL